LGIDKNTVKSGTYQTIINGESVSSAVMHNPRLKISLLPSSPDLAGAEVELIEVLAREGRLKNALQAVQDRYDYILIDCPPSLGLLTINGMVAAQDGLLIPVQCEYLALEGISQLVSTIERVRQAVFPKLTIRGVILTMYDSRTNLAKDVVDEIRKHFPNEAMETVIPRSVRLAEAPSYGLPILSYHPSSPGAVAYDQLARELLKKDGVKLAV